MSDNVKVLIGIAIPFLGTSLGAGMVFFLKGEMSQRLQKLLLGFASGVMIAAAVWSLLIPAIDMAEAAGTAAWVPALVGFLVGIGFLLVLDILPKQGLPAMVFALQRDRRRRGCHCRFVAILGLLSRRLGFAARTVALEGIGET